MIRNAVECFVVGDARDALLTLLESLGEPLQDEINQRDP